VVALAYYGWFADELFSWSNSGIKVMVHRKIRLAPCVKSLSSKMFKRWISLSAEKATAVLVQEFADERVFTWGVSMMNWLTHILGGVCCVQMWVRSLLSICIGCIIAKTNIHVCDVGYYVPTCFRHFCKMLDMMFQHPDTVQCALFYVWLYACFILLRNPCSHILLTKQRAYLFRISCVFIPKGVTIF